MGTHTLAVRAVEKICGPQTVGMAHMVPMERVVMTDTTRLAGKGTTKGTLLKGKVLDTKKDTEKLAPLQRVERKAVGTLGMLGIPKALRATRQATLKVWEDLAKARKRAIWQVWKPQEGKQPRQLVRDGRLRLHAF